MKKAIKLALYLALVPVMLITSVQHAYCIDSAYYISDYKIFVEVNEDGSADIEEHLSYSFKGQFNGILRNIDFSDTKGLTDQKVYVKRNGSLTEFKQNASNPADESGKPGTYNLNIKGSIAYFKIFEPSANEEKTFVISYTFQDAITRYNDVATFNRKLVDSGWETRLDNVYIRITIPEGASIDEIKVFGHGPLTGESRIVDERTLEFTVPSVPPHTFVETLVVFPPRLVPGSGNVVNRDELPNILNNEKQLAEAANKKRDEARREIELRNQLNRDLQSRQVEERMQKSVYGNVAAALLLLLWLYIIISIYIKYDRELKHSFEGKYYRELPGDYTPAEMSVLLSFGHVQSRDIMATLMDLVRKKQLELISVKQVKKGLFGKKEKTEYILSVNPRAPHTNLKEHESFLIDWFIGKIGDGASVSLEEIQKYVQNSSRAMEFKEDYDRWCRLAVKEAEKNNFFDESVKKGRITGVIAGLSYVAAGILIGVLFHTPAAFILSILGVGLAIYSSCLKRYTAYGNEQKVMWLAFRNFLNDFSNMEKAVIPSIVIWEHYLVYAISLGVAKKVIKQLPLVFADYDFNDERLTFMHSASYGYFTGIYSLLDNTINTVEGAIDSAVSIANSAYSSSSGEGGGFSAGTSGGGGGGGGGGAF